MSAVERFRRLLHEMTALEKAVYTAVLVGFFVLGLVMPLLAPKETYARLPKVVDLLSDQGPLIKPLVIAIVLILAAVAAGATAVFMVRMVPRLRTFGVPIFGRWFDRAQLLHIKLFVLALPALGAGYVAAMALGWLGVYETPSGFYAFYTANATVYICAGIAGVVAMSFTPEYKLALRAPSEDRIAAQERTRPERAPETSQMTWLEKVVYSTDILCFFVLGLVIPSLAPREIYANFQGIGDELGSRNPFANPFFVAIVVIVAAGTAGLAGAFIARLAALSPSIGFALFGKRFDLAQLVFVKLALLALPALASGFVAAMALGRVGIYDTPSGFYAFYAFLANQYLCGGIAGIATMRFMPQYERALPRLMAELLPNSTR